MLYLRNNYALIITAALFVRLVIALVRALVALALRLSIALLLQYLASNKPSI